MKKKKIIIVGTDGYIGSALWRHFDEVHEVIGTTRNHASVMPHDLIHLDLLDIPQVMPDADVVYICAAMTRFIDCESDRLAYRVNVDAPAAIARRYDPAFTRIVYLSSEAVERALHTNYGMHKALAEMTLRGYENTAIARLSKVTPEKLPMVCAFLGGLMYVNPGVYQMPESPASVRAVA